MVLDDIKKFFDALVGQLSPEKAQELAKRYLGRGADKDQIAKTAGELIDLSQRLRESVRKEVASRMRLDGRGDTGRSRRAQETGARPGTCGGHDRIRPQARSAQADRTEEDRGSEYVLDFDRPPEIVRRLLTGPTGWAVAASTPSWCAAA